MDAFLSQVCSEYVDMVFLWLFKTFTRSEIQPLGRYESINADIRALTRAFDSNLFLGQLSPDLVYGFIWFLVSQVVRSHTFMR